MKHILLDYLVKNLYANGHNSRPLCRQRTIQAVLDISRLPSARSVTQIWCHQSIMRSAMKLVQSQRATSYRAHLSSREIAISTSDTASEQRSVESKVWRYPKRPGSSIGDEMVENGDRRRIGSNQLCCALKCRMVQYDGEPL